jgi:hypothetical protein
MNGFQKHGITHTSPSSINLFAEAPDVYVAEKLFGYKGRMSPAAYRGIVIEKAVSNIIAKGESEEKAVSWAILEFNREVALYGSDKIEEEREMIAPCVQQALEVLKPYGQPEFAVDGKQDKIELLCKGNGWELPVIGYTDFPFPKHGVIIDLKTTSRIPSVMSDAHNRQAAIYRKASGNMAVKFLYVSSKKSALHECADIDGTLAEIKMILNRQEKFLSMGDKETLREIVHFNPSTFYWTGAESNRKEVYGF